MEASGEVSYNLNVDKAYTLSLPLDSDMDDTVLLGFDLDLVATLRCHPHRLCTHILVYSLDGIYVIKNVPKMYWG